MRRLRAFSLSEILAVIAIMAALAAILFPVFSRVREAGRRSICLSNLRQFGMAIDMYRRDWDGQDAVKGVRKTHSELGLPYSASALWGSYIRDEAVRRCPSSRWIGRHAPGYWWQLTRNEMNAPEADYPALYADKAEGLAAVICPAHNDFYALDPSAATDIRVFVVLRLNGSISVRRFYGDEPVPVVTM